MVGLTAVLFVSVFLSGISVFYFRGLGKNYLKLLLTFSGAYLFALAILHLIPEVYSGNDPKVSWFILGGFFIQILLETFSEGIEHGHIHIHKSHSSSFPLALMAGLCLHSFLEGMPLVARLGKDSFYPLVGGIILHHIPVAMALVGMLVGSGLNRRTTITMLALFCLMAPAGAMFSNLISDFTTQDLSAYFNRIMGLVIGIFLHISTTILFESYEEHRFNYYKLVTILLGAGAAMIV
jgi:zinc and cadmium transporter